ncbi:alpha/beta fold hydrolase [Streptomyces sp. NPDC006172]|uniref:thioesterase II family protein n=1 Tax=Streptomyces sp. NPDC006172 TaxID=3154470 RepID=UPI0033E863B3
MTVVQAATGADWFRVYVPRPSARLRLFCFPHAGGAASTFRELARLAPPDVELVAVQYPGRQDRFGEPLADTLDALVRDVTAALLPRLDRPAAFLGHSMGGTVAFEVARRLRATHPGAPAHLFVSARKAPHIDMGRALAFRDDADAMAYVQALGGAGAALLADPELRELTLPVLRGDFRLVETYRFRPSAPLTCPITVVTGDTDPSCGPDDAARWARHTVAAHTVRTLPGGHFYLETAGPQLMSLIAEALCAAPASIPAPAGQRVTTHADRGTRP